ncbi:hypothetical protein [Ulvibacterium sp.]|uniref:hypothetical protein n=1 Tax=Ulvibacterium sp. TaxID=2665914 RepID=UPI003BABC340
MKAQLKFFAILALVLSILGCGANARLTNSNRGLFKVKSMTESVAKEIVDVNLSIIPIPPKKSVPKIKPKTFFSLNDSTQTAYLKILAGMTRNPDTLIKYIKMPLSDVTKTKSKRSVDFTKISVRFFLSNIKRYYKFDETYEYPKNRDSTFLHTNTRLEYLNTTIELGESSGVEVVTIDKLKNEFESIDLGTLERTNNVTFNTKLSAEYGIGNEDTSTSLRSLTSGSGGNTSETTTQNIYDEDGNLLSTVVTGVTPSNNTSTTNSINEVNSNKLNAGAKAEVSYNNNEAIKEALASKLARLKTGFSFTENKIKVAQRGDITRDISDNIFITATVSPTSNLDETLVHSFNGLFKNKVENKASAIEVSKRVIKYICCTNNFVLEELPIDFKVDGVLRTVKNERRGRNNYEFDDKVTYYIFNYEPEQEPLKIPLSPYCKKIYTIKAKFKDLSHDLTLKIDLPDESDVLLLEDEEPYQVLEWVRQMINAPSKEKLEGLGYRMYFDSPQGQIFLVNRKMTTDDISKLKKIEKVFLYERR